MDIIGFTDDEINQLNSPRDNNFVKEHDSNRAQEEKIQRTHPHSTSNTVGKQIGRLDGACLSKPVIIKADKGSEIPGVEEVAAPPPCNEATSQPVEGENPFKPDVAAPAVAAPAEAAPATPPPDPALSKLQQMQIAQGKLEKQNKQKQKALKQTITEKFAKTAEHAQLLASLQQEVSSVEKDLSCDITILMDRIDHSNRRYFDARKRLEAAEAEYVAAKIDLHHSQELKDGLEEHLFTIIKLSETKKSERLEQLNQKLESLNL